MVRVVSAVHGYEPPAGRGENSVRVQHTRARLRLLNGGWERDAKDRIKARLGSVRARALGYPDLSANPFRSTCQQAATLYNRPPVIWHPDDETGEASMLLSAAMAQAGTWSLMKRVQRNTIGLREMLIRVDCSDAGELLLRPVTPDLVEAEPDEDRPERPAATRELRRRIVEGESRWTRDVIDPRGADPFYTVESLDGDDMSEVLGAPASGDAYEYRLEDGTAVLPYVLYHAERTGSLWDPFEAIELVEGTYEVSVLWSFWTHLTRDASWPQRWAIGVRLAGVTQSGPPGAPANTVETDPAVVIMLVPTDQEGTTTIAQVGQWQPGGDPEKLAASILSYEGRLPGYANLNPADFTRTSGDPRSGYALALSRDGQREAARAMEPQFREGDGWLCTLCAAQLNRWSERAARPLHLPEVGWQLSYPGIPESADERKAKRDDVFEQLDRGLMSRVEAYAKLRDVSVGQAKKALALIDRELEQRARLKPRQEGEPDKDDEQDEDEDEDNAQEGAHG
jgi:hypothetical protein